MNLLNPIALWLLAIAPIIILLYLLKLKRKPVEISSTLLWFRAVQDLEANSPFQRLRKNLLLLLQLLILFLLIFALARPYLMTASRVQQSIAILLDNSASMQSIDVAPSRFEEARGKVRELIQDLSEGDEAMLILASHKAQVLQSLTGNKDELLRALAQSAPVDTGTDLTEAFLLAQSLVQDRPGNEIIIVSDGSFPALPPLGGKKVQARFIPVGQRCENLALTALDIRSDPSVPGAYQLFTSVSNYCPGDRTADLELYIDHEIVDSQEIQVPSGGSNAQIFRLSGVEKGILQVRLNFEDDLAVDNEAYAIFAPEPVMDVLLAGRPNFFLERVLSLDSRVHVSVSEEVEALEPQGYDLVIYNGVCPKVLSPNGNYVFLGCVPESWEAKLTGPVLEYPSVMDWNRTHALMRFVSFDSVSIARSMRMTLPASAEVLVESEQTPLIAMSIEQGRFLSVFISFDPLDSNWLLRASFPIFMTNLVDFCRESPGGLGTNQYETGRPAPIFIGSLPPSEEINIQLSARSGEKTRSGHPSYRVPVLGDPVYFVSTDLAGLYEVRAPGWEPRHLAINLLSQQESDIHSKSEIQLGSSKIAGEKGPVQTNQEIWKSLTIIALLLLLFEWWVYHRRIGV